MIVTVRQLQIIHYYYFLMGIFSFTNAFFLGMGSVFSLIFIGFYAMNSLISWYMAYVARRKMSDYVVVQSLGFGIRHMVVTIATVFLTTLVWVSDVIPDRNFLSTIIMANYMVIFLAGMWYMLTRASFVKKLFTVYDNRIFRKSKEFIIKIRNVHRNFFGREIVNENDIDKYKYGTIKEIDDNMISAWKNREKTQYVLECIGRIELSLARYLMKIMKEKISFLMTQPPNPRTDILISKTEKSLANDEQEIIAYEKEFYRKTGESEFI